MKKGTLLFSKYVITYSLCELQTQKESLKIHYTAGEKYLQLNLSQIADFCKND